ncbi:MAG: beta-galactosidase [Bacilli bacterium]|nr:beta-galactosidase [Bacilli bacterium]
MISYADRQFNLDGKKEFIFGGELHYFRVPRPEWRDRIRKIKAAGMNLVSTYVPWLWHETQKGDFDFTGRTRPEKDLVSFLKICHEEEMFLLVRPGPYVMAETVNSGIPLWLISEHEEISAMKEDGTHHQVGGLVSYMHPTYLGAVEVWYRNVFSVLVPYEIQNGGPIIMIQYDNEVGMFHWVTTQGDYSDTTLNYFRDYIIEKYGAECFSPVLSRFNDFSEYMKAFMRKETLKQESFIINQEYKEFFRVYIRKYVEALIEMGKQFGSQVPPVVNVHGFSSVDYAKRGNRYPVGLSQLHETAKIPNVIIAGDYYVGNIVSDNYFDVIIANSFTEAVQPEGQPLFSAEFQSGFQNGIPRLQPTTHDLKTRLSIACGMNAINYYMFVGGENYEEIGMISRRHDWQAPIATDGTLRNHYHVIHRLIKTIRSYGSALLEAQLKIDTHIAFDPDYFMNEYNNHHTQGQSNQITHDRQTYLFNGVGKSLAMKNIAFASVDLLKKESIPVDSVPTLIAFSTDWMSERSQRILVDYIENGGKLFLYPRIPIKNLTDESCTLLKDYIGVDIVKDSFGRVKILEEDSVNCHKAQVYDVDSGFATMDLDETKVTGFSKEIGKGEVVVFGMQIRSDWDYIDDIMVDVLAKIGVTPTVNTEEWLQIMIRKGKKGSFVFINNFEEFDKESVIYSGKEKLFGGAKLFLPMRRGVILPLDWQVDRNLTIKYSTAEVSDLDISDSMISIRFKPLRKHEEIVFEGDFDIESTSKLERHKNKITILDDDEAEIIWKRRTK